MVEADRAGAQINNVSNFFNLLEACRPDQKLIYASSASIYSGAGGTAANEEWLGFWPHSLYDVHKKHCDDLALLSQHRRRVYGLRFGTVSGWSANIRTDVVINRMIKDAVTSGRITLRNPHVHRTLLFIKDLCAALAVMIERDGPSGIYNLGSVSMRMDTVAYVVADFTGAEIRLLPLTASYDFTMCSEKFCRTFDFAFDPRIEHCLQGLVNADPASWQDRQAAPPYRPRA